VEEKTIPRIGFQQLRLSSHPEYEPSLVHMLALDSLADIEIDLDRTSKFHLRNSEVLIKSESGPSVKLFDKNILHLINSHSKNV